MVLSLTQLIGETSSVSSVVPFSLLANYQPPMSLISSILDLRQLNRAFLGSIAVKQDLAQKNVQSNEKSAF